MSDQVKIVRIICIMVLSAIMIIGIFMNIGLDKYYVAVKELQLECLRHEGNSYLAGKDWCLAPGISIK